jgi:spore germination protein KC
MMKKSIVLILVLFIQINTLTSCWSYREINELAIVAGAVIDIDENDKYMVCAEIVKTEQGGRGTATVSSIVSSSGDTLFDAFRNMISVSKKRLFWSHTKLFIISEKLAKKSIVPIIDWVVRDAETRRDALICITTEKEACDVLENNDGKSDILSYDLSEMIMTQESLSKAPITHIWEVAKNLSEPTACSIIPIITIKKIIDKKLPHVGGTAICKRSKMVGMLNEEETKSLLFVIDKVKGGIIPAVIKSEGNEYTIAYEISESKTSLKAIAEDNKISTIEIEISTTGYMGEVDSPVEATNDENLQKIKEKLQNEIKTNIEKTCKKVFSEYKTDVFGFAGVVFRQKPKIWKKYEDDESKWENNLQKLKIKVKSEIQIEASGYIKNEIPSR